jgi:hypothetical protein
MRCFTAPAALLVSLAFVPSAALAHDLSVQVRPGHEVRTCDDLEVTFDDRPALTAVDRLTAPGAQKLMVHSSRNGGTYVFGGSRQDFAISVCKAAAPSAGAGVLDQLKANVSGGTLSASGPRSDGWVVYFIIDAPAKADLDVDATNGPIHLARLSGTTNVLAQNGPIKLLDVGGRVTARTQNGPIAYHGSGGTVELTAQNGPLAIHLSGDKWTDGTLTATAQNGPVKVQAPRGFASGVRVRSSEHSPWKCQGCDDGRRTWDDSGRSVEFGTGPVAVTVSTHNGPVAVDLTR